MNKEKNKQRLVDSIKKNSPDFQFKGNKHWEYLADNISDLDFSYAGCSFSDDIKGFDVLVKLSSGVELSFILYLTDEVGAPVIFTLYRGRALLIWDELDLESIVEKINSADR